MLTGPRSRKASCPAVASRSCAPRRPSGAANLHEDQKHGVDIVRKALSWRARQIAFDAGEDGSVIVGKILEKDTYAFGFDARSGEYGNMLTKGIIDPTKVVRARRCKAQRRTAGFLITTEAMVASLPEKNQGQGAMPGGGGMDF